jgi:micrococcal nuclease
MYEYKSEVLRVVDADTLDLRVDMGFRHFQDMRVRLARIDAWEKRGEEREKGLEATQFVLELFANLEDDYVVIRTQKDKQGKYGRYIAEVVIMNPDGTEKLNLNELLVEKGHAGWWPG